MTWLGRVTAAARALTDKKGTVVATCTTREGWSQYGIPSDSGDGFAYNREGWLGWLPAEQRILQLATAMACVRLLSQTIATLPIGIYRRLGDGSRKAAPDHPLYEILHNQPNSDMTAVDFWQVMLAWMLLRGTGYAEKGEIGGRLVSLTPLYVPGLTWTREANGSKRYRYVDPDTGRSRDIGESKLWILPAFTLNGETGISPICYGANVFGTAMAADEASRNVFANGLSASGFIQYGKEPTHWLKKEQRDSIKSSINEFSGSRRAGKTMVLEGGMTYSQLSMNPEDAQMLETRSFNIEEICRWFGVPPTLIGHGDKTSNWGTGLEQQNLSFLTYSLRPWLAKIEQSIRKNLLPIGEKTRYFAEFSVEGLLRADTAGRAAWYRAMTDIGAMYIDEVRGYENLAPLGGNAGKPTIQSARVPLDKLGETPPTQPPPVVPAEEAIP
jgi:HK97 family phage portal protein